MFSYDLCPPPDFVEAGVGESRNVRYTPVGIACGDEIMNVGGVEARHVFSENAESACSEQYDKLVQAIEDNKAKASSSSPPPL